MRKLTENKYFTFRYGIPQVRNLRYYCHYLILVLSEPFLKLWIYIYGKKIHHPQNCKYDISICGIFKNEAKYLKEWIVYHQLLGVKHFYLYNNNSDDDYLEILQPFVEEDIVTLIEWPENPGQLSSYKHWYHTYRFETEWVSFLDIDEFICPRKAITIREWLNDYKIFPIVMAYWKFFSSSGKIEHNNNQLVIEQYHSCFPKYRNVGKLFYNTKFDISSFSPGMMHHFCVKVKGLSIPPVNCFKHFVFFDIDRVDSIEFSIQVNHYWSRSYESYLKKHERGSAVFGKSWKTFDRFIINEWGSTATDHLIDRFVIQTKLMMDGKYPLETNEGVYKQP